MRPGQGQLWLSIATRVLARASTCDATPDTASHQLEHCSTYPDVYRLYSTSDGAETEQAARGPPQRLIYLIPQVGGTDTATSALAGP